MSKTESLLKKLYIAFGNGTFKVFPTKDPGYERLL